MLFLELFAYILALDIAIGANLKRRSLPEYILSPWVQNLNRISQSQGMDYAEFGSPNDDETASSVESELELSAGKLLKDIPGDIEHERSKRSSDIPDTDSILNDLNSQITSALKNLADNNEFIESSAKAGSDDIQNLLVNDKRRKRAAPNNLINKTKLNNSPGLEDQINPTDKIRLANELEKMANPPPPTPIPTIPTGPLGPIHLELLQKLGSFPDQHKSVQAKDVFSSPSRRNRNRLFKNTQQSPPFGKAKNNGAKRLFKVIQNIMGRNKKLIHIKKGKKANKDNKQIFTLGVDKVPKKDKTETIGNDGGISVKIGKYPVQVPSETEVVVKPVASLQQKLLGMLKSGGPITHRVDYLYVSGGDYGNDDYENVDFDEKKLPASIPKVRLKRVRRQSDLLPESDELAYYDLDDGENLTPSNEVDIIEKENFDILENNNPEGIGVHDLDLYGGPRAQFPTDEVIIQEHQRKKRSYKTHLKPLGGKPFGPLAQEEDAEEMYGDAFEQNPEDIPWEEPEMMDNCWAMAMLSTGNFSPSCNADGSFAAKQCNLQRCWCVSRDGTPEIDNPTERFYYSTKGIVLECSQNP